MLSNQGELPPGLTLDELQQHIWGFLFQPNTGLLANVEHSVQQSQSAVVSGIAYHSNALSSQVSATSNAINTHISNSTTQIANQLGYVFNSLYNQLTSSITAVQANINKTENDIKQNNRDNATAIENYSNALSQDIKHNIDISHASIASQLGIVENGITGALDSANNEIDNRLASIQASVDSFVGTAIGGIEDALKNIFTPVIDFVDSLLDLFKNWFRQNVTDKVDTFFDELLKFQKVHYDIFTGNFPNNPNLLQDMGIASEHGAISSKILLLLLSIPTIIGLFSKITEPSWREFVYGQEALVASRILDLDSYVSLYLKGYATIDDLYGYAANLGLNKSNVNLYLKAIRRLPDLTTLQTEYLRGFINHDMFVNYLKGMGLIESDIDNIIKTFDVIPPLSDIITMAVREVFSPEISVPFGQFQDYPELLTGWAAKHGLSEQWAKNYWAAHWTLPSVNQAFEMLHRRVITFDEMELLLKALDVMPHWREKLTHISYNPLTRVDVRRMYRVGVLNRDEVKSAYLDLGYDDTNSERLTEFTIRYETPDTTDENSQVRDLTKSVILKAYNRNTINRGEATIRLLHLGYVQSDIDLLLTLQDYDKQIDDYPDRSKEFNTRMSDVIISMYRKGTISRDNALETLKSSGFRDNDAEIALTSSDLEYQQTIRSGIVSEVKQLYIERTIDSTELTNLLNNYRFTPDEIRRTLAELNTVKDLRSKKPTEAQLAKLYTLKVLDDSQFKEELRGLGFAEKYLDWMITLANS